MEQFKNGHIQEPKRSELCRQFANTINRLSLENLIDEPDYLIAELLVRELEKMTTLKKVYDSNKEPTVLWTIEN